MSETKDEVDRRTGSTRDRNFSYLMHRVLMRNPKLNELSPKVEAAYQALMLRKQQSKS